jgi:hypothetical protein
MKSALTENAGINDMVDGKIWISASSGIMGIA